MRALRGRYGFGHAHALEAKCPHGSEIQSLLFDRRFFDLTRARAWAKGHDRKYGDVDMKDAYIHLRQEPPSLFSRMRTIPLGRRGVKAVIGWQKC